MAQAQLGKPFRLGTQGPNRFDCSGLVYFVFSRTGLLDRIGGRRMVADEYYHWGRERGLLSATNPRVGDLALWKYPDQKRVKHMGIYIGKNLKGQDLAISALTVGVSRHRTTKISIPFLTYVRIGLGGSPPPSPSPSPTQSPSPSPTLSPSPSPTQSPSPGPTPTTAVTPRVSP